MQKFLVLVAMFAIGMHLYSQPKETVTKVKKKTTVATNKVKRFHAKSSLPVPNFESPMQEEQATPELIEVANENDLTPIKDSEAMQLAEQDLDHYEKYLQMEEENKNKQEGMELDPSISYSFEESGGDRSLAIEENSYEPIENSNDYNETNEEFHQ